MKVMLNLNHINNDNDDDDDDYEQLPDIIWQQSTYMPKM